MRVGLHWLQSLYAVGRAALGLPQVPWRSSLQARRGRLALSIVTIHSTCEAGFSQQNVPGCYPACSWQHEEQAAGLAPGVADLLQGHLCGVGCMHGAPADEPTQVQAQPRRQRAGPLGCGVASSGPVLLIHSTHCSREPPSCHWLDVRLLHAFPTSAAQFREAANQVRLPSLPSTCCFCRRSTRLLCGRATSCCRAPSRPSMMLWRRWVEAADWAEHTEVDAERHAGYANRRGARRLYAACR